MAMTKTKQMFVTCGLAALLIAALGLSRRAGDDVQSRSNLTEADAIAPALDPANWGAPRLRISPNQPKSDGLCGTEIPMPEGSGGRVPSELVALAVGIPSAAEIDVAAKAWGMDSVDAVDVSKLAEEGEARRESLEYRTRERPESDEESTIARIHSLVGLGRLTEALESATVAHERWLNVTTTKLLAEQLVEVPGHLSEARQFVQAALAGTLPALEDRDWLTLSLGYACSQLRDADCVNLAVHQLASGAMPRLASSLRGFDLGWQDRFEEAGVVLRQSLTDEGEGFVTLANIALFESMQGQAASAQSWWERSSEFAFYPRHFRDVLAGAAYTYHQQGDVSSAWIAASAALTASGQGEAEAGPRKVLALAALDMGDLGEARREIRNAISPTMPADPLWGDTYAHPAETASLRALFAEARGDTNAAREFWLQVARSNHAGLRLCARRALLELCS
jgi:hypothetical protein